MEYLSFIILTGVLIIIGLYLGQFEPPIKKQWIALMLLVTGLVLGHFMIGNPAYGFLIAGLVYYKDQLVAEVRDVKESFTEIKNEKDELEV